MANTETVGQVRPTPGSGIRTAEQGRELLQHISEGFILVDRQLRVSDVNAAGLRMAGQPRSEFVGRSLSEIAPDLKHSVIGRKWVKAMREGKPVASEQRHTWTDGRESWLQMRGHPTSAGFAIFYRDITRRKRSEEELKRTRTELIHASRVSAMGTMAATMAHELAQPLTSAGAAINAGIRLLEPLPEAEVREVRRAIDMAGASVRRGREILKRLRALVAKGQARAATEDLEAIITDASVLVFPQAQREGVELRLEYDPRARWVMADAVQIQQVLINLIKNALEAMSGMPDGVVTVQTEAVSADCVAVTVEDNGPGLPDTAPDAVFTPFHSSKEDGLGVGLSVCRTIVEAHGGTIEAGRAAAGGARFRFTLPRAGGPQVRPADPSRH